MGEFSHVSVLLEEAVDGLNVKPDGVYVDCTLGAGGHAALIASKLKGGRLIAIDQDREAIAAARETLKPFGDTVLLIHDNFENAGAIIDTYANGKIDGALMDLGVSSHQLDTPERGFSYHLDGRLDMRMNPDAALSAYRVVNEYPEGELRRIIQSFGEEKRASQVAKAIVRAREKKVIESTLELSEIVKSAFPIKERMEGKHPARRTFQALRMEVNRELAVIPETIEALEARLKPGGRLSVITFHSLEDRTVKEKIRSYIEGCTCPKDFPVCVCRFRPSLKKVSRKPLTASPEELEANARSRSAKLRIAEKI